MNKQRLIFLDIDGPMIPSGCFLLFGRGASFDRKYSPISVSCLNNLCHQSKAKIVFNTTHNNDDQLVEDSIREGIKKGHIYSGDCKTKYPQLENRLDAINLWLDDTGNTENPWVAFDDCIFNSDRLIYVDYDDGLNVRHCNEAMNILGKGVPTLIF